MQPTLIIHGGAWDIDPAEHADHLAGVESAAQAAWSVLSNNGSALDAIQKAVMMMEDDPSFDAGKGSVLNCIGEIELDAMIMCGKNLKTGAVGAIQGVRYPINVARLVMEEGKHNLLVGRGAHAFARMQGIQFVPQAELTVPREVQHFYDYQKNPPSTTAQSFTGTQSGGTVGAVAMDHRGHIAAATSTGGVSYSLPGRVGDSPLIGCGTYADNESGGASCTGHGERIMQVVLAKHATDLIKNGQDAPTAAQNAIDHLHTRVKGYGGIILIDKNGNFGFAHNTPHMACAWADENGQIRSYIKP